MNSGTDYPSLVTRIRKARSLTQEQLAHELGVTFSTVNGWENGRHRPSPLAMKALMQLAEEVGIHENGPSRQGGSDEMSAPVVKSRRQAG